MIYCGAYKSNYWAVSNYYYAILKDPKGIYYSYVFGINNTNYGEAPTITGVTQKALPDETQVLLNNILTGTNKNLFEIGAGDNADGFQAPNGKERINSFSLQETMNSGYLTDQQDYLSYMILLMQPSRLLTRKYIIHGWPVSDWRMENSISLKSPMPPMAENILKECILLKTTSEKLLIFVTKAVQAGNS